MPNANDKIEAAKSAAVDDMNQADQDVQNTPAPSADDVAAIAGGADVATPEAGASVAGPEGEGSQGNPSPEELWGEDGMVAQAFKKLQDQGINPIEALQAGAAQLLQAQQGGGDQGGAPAAGDLQGIPSQAQGAEEPEVTPAAEEAQGAGA